MLVDNSSISNISVQSKNKSYSKNSPSTSLKNHREHDFHSYDDYWTSECDIKKAQTLHKTIEEMEKNQEAMEKKFQQCIETMLGEIERNNENNARLALEVNKLKTQVYESKKDILIIEEFLNANSKKQSKKREGINSGGLNRAGSSRDLFGSGSVSRNILGRRAASKFFKSKLLTKA